MDSRLRNLLISTILMGIVSGFVLISLPLYLIELGLDIGRIGVLFGIATFFYGILAYYLGALSDYYGRLRFGMIFLFLLFIGTLLYGMLTFIPLAVASIVFIISKIISSASETVLGNIIKIRVADISKKATYGKSYGYLIFAISFGGAVGMLLSGLLLKFISFSQIFFISSVILLVSLVLFNFSGDYKWPKKRRKTFHLWDINKLSQKFKLVLILSVLISMTISLVDFYAIPLFLKEELGFKSDQILLALGIPWLIYSFASPYAGKLFDRFGLKAFIAGLFLIGITSILLALTQNPFIFIGILILDYIFFSMSDASRFTLQALVSERRGSLMSLFLLFSGFIGSLLFLGSGYIIVKLGFDSLFIFRALIQFICIGVVIQLMRKLR